MRVTRVRGIVALVTIVMTLAVVASAIGLTQTVTNRSITAADGSLTIAVESVGNAGAIHGNVNYWTSPVDPSGTFEWFNKAVRITDFAMPDVGNGVPVFEGALYAINADGSGYTGFALLHAPYSLAYDGVYSIVATGTDSAGDVSGEITPAFGVDQTDPVVTTDRVPFYRGTPTVAVTATDSVSGVESVLFNVDGMKSDSWEPDPADPTSFTATFPFVGDGTHTFNWTAFDNAGNAVHGSETFVVDNTAPITSSDAIGTYNGAATIHLSAMDPGGSLASGVGATYYSLDGSPTVAGTVIDVPAPVDGQVAHAIEYWSVDAVGNEETPHTIKLFTVNSQHSITVTPPTNGTITPSGVATINYMANSAVYQIKPKTGYHITDVKVDGVSVGKPTTYQFFDVVANHTIAATFAINTYTLTPSKSNSHGSISPSSKQTVNYGASKKFTMTPASHYKISKVVVDGVSKGHPSTYTFSNVKGNHTIKVYFVHK